MNQKARESESNAQVNSISTNSFQEALPRNEQTVDGMTIERGVMPAKRVKGHATAPGYPNAMHGGTPPNSDSNHILVALFDAKTGARNTDAQIRADVGNRWYSHDPDWLLEPMEISGTKSYGNFFSMQDAGIWRIHLLTRPGIARPVEADFGFEQVSS